MSRNPHVYDTSGGFVAFTNGKFRSVKYLNLPQFILFWLLFASYIAQGCKSSELVLPLIL